MYLEDAKILISKRWLVEFPKLAPDVPTVMDNEAADETMPSYVRLSFQSMTPRQTTMGAKGTRRIERNGLVALKLNVTPDQGSNGADKLFKHVQAVLELERIAASAPDDFVELREADPREIGLDGQFWTLLVTIPFRFWNLK